MSLQDRADAAGVNPHNGSSVDSVQAARFQGLWEQGALDSQKPAEAQQLRDERARTAAPATPEPRQERTRPELRAVPTPEQRPPEAAPEAAPLAAPEAEQATDEGPEYADLDDYLTRSQIERESFYTIPVAIKVDGKSSTVPLADLVRSYQTDAHVTQRSQELANRAREWEGQQRQASEALTQTLKQAEALLGVAFQQAVGTDAQALERLKVEDPFQWSIRNQEHTARINQLQGFLQQVQQAGQQAAQQQEQQLRARLPQEWQRAVEQVPTWRDDKVFQADRVQMYSAGQKLGYTPAELSQIFDHRQLVGLYYASQALKLQAQAPQALKKVRAAPQMASPGTRAVRDPNQAARANLKQQAFSAQGRRNQDVQAAYFEELARAGA